MIVTYVLTIGLILILMLGWILVQQSYKLFAHRHPELGPFRDENGGCGCCANKSSCSTGSCSTSHGG